MNEPFWFVEDGAQKVAIRYRCQSIVYSGRTRFAKVDIVDTEEYGRMLFLDGIAQSAEQDEFIYHESLVHPPMLMHPNPTSVCIIGGAEGATIREVAKYRQVNQIVMVDIDEELVDICRQYLSDWNDSAFEDPRLEVKFVDGRKFLEETDYTFDVIIVDLNDPTPDSPAVFLFTREFYQLIFSRLGRDGVGCFQGTDLQPTKLSLHARMFNTLSSVFKWVVAYPYMMSSFHEMHSLILASKELDVQSIDLGERLRFQNFRLQYLSPAFLNCLFSVPAYVEEAYQEYKELITDAAPTLYDS
jgi:spermidine synthase